MLFIVIKWVCLGFIHKGSSNSCGVVMEGLRYEREKEKEKAKLKNDVFVDKLK